MSGDERPDADSDSSDDCCFGDVGFMFDNALPKTRRSFRFGDISVAVRLVDDDPGAVQSGHYVWPAAPALSAYLVDCRSALPRGGKCVELGAGCGLAGLVAAQLPSTTAVVFTDHDPGVLELIKDSIAEHAQDPELGGSDAAAKCCCVQLSWGPVGKSQRALLSEALTSVMSSSPSHPLPTGEASAEGHGGGGGGDDGSGSGGGGGGGGGGVDDGPFFDLVIGSDVIYSVSVVAPLFQTVSGLLQPKTSSCSSSETPIDRCCGDGAGGLGATATNPQTSSRQGKKEEAAARRGCAGGPGGGASSEEGTEAAGSSRTPSRSFDGDRLSSGGSGDGGDVGAPVFLMSQSFGYDAETERAIGQACLELGLVREVVWDELVLGPAGNLDDQQEHVQQPPPPEQQPQPPPPQRQHRQVVGVIPAPEKRLHPKLNSSNDVELLPLSQERRAGTKLQRFWRA